MRHARIPPVEDHGASVAHEHVAVRVRRSLMARSRRGSLLEVVSIPRHHEVKSHRPRGGSCPQSYSLRCRGPSGWILRPPRAWCASPPGPTPRHSIRFGTAGLGPMALASQAWGGAGPPVILGAASSAPRSRGAMEPSRPHLNASSRGGLRTARDTPEARS
jgi:hypothetical protein